MVLCIAAKPDKHTGRFNDPQDMLFVFLLLWPCPFLVSMLFSQKVDPAEKVHEPSRVPLWIPAVLLLGLVVGGIVVLLLLR